MCCLFEDEIIFRQFVSNINYKHSQLYLPAGSCELLLYMFLQIIFLQPVSLSHQAFNTVPVNCLFKIFTAYGKPGLQRSS